MKSWYVAKVKPRKEGLLIDYLSNREVGVYFPKILRTTRRGRVLEALFPTYLFCRLDPHSPGWPLIRWAPGLSYFLGSDGEPSPVPETLIGYLQSRVNWWNGEGFRRRLTPGERVRVVGGPFDGLEGIFQKYVPARQRCRVLLRTVSRLMAAEVPEEQLLSVASSQLPSLGLSGSA